MLRNQFILFVFLTFHLGLSSQNVGVISQTAPTCVSAGLINFTVNSTVSPFQITITNTNCLFPTGFISTTSATNTITINNIPGCNSPYTFWFYDINSNYIGNSVQTFPVPSPCLSVFANNSAITCMGQCDATGTIVPFTGTPPYSYTWTPNGVNTATARLLCAGSFTLFVKDALGIEGYCNLIILNPPNPCVGIKEYDLLEKVKVYPNPVSNSIFISDEKGEFKKSEIEIVNYLGQTVLNSSFQTEIDVSSLNNGYYYLIVIKPDHHRYFAKFIKE